MTWTLDKWKFLRENAATMTRRELAQAMGVSYTALSAQCSILGIKTKDAEPEWRREMKEAKAKKLEQPQPLPPEPEPEPEPESAPPAPKLIVRRPIKPVKIPAPKPEPVKERTTPLTWGGRTEGEKPYEFVK